MLQNKGCTILNIITNYTLKDPKTFHVKDEGMQE